ncbi:MAG TPA: pyruvate ferredoxin oxidoreductase [Thermofilum sp.]|nr:pyruvate ferredoxin oxidoreductase [Thermofilum sp.]
MHQRVSGEGNIHGKRGVLKVLSGNHAAAYGAKLSRPDVIAAYPITPQTPIIEKLSEFVESGELDARLIRVESEHSAMAASIGAASVGARTYTATSSQGLLYMYEVCWWAVGARLPIVMGVVTRALAPPWSIWSDHNDLLTLRDSGWIILFASDSQEILDMTIQAYKIAESVYLPVVIGWDAFLASHTVEPVLIPDQEIVDKFLPKKRGWPHALSVEDPFSLGNITFPSEYMELRYDIWRSMNDTRELIKSVDKEYGRITGREYGGLVERYLCDDSEAVLFVMGSSSGDAMEAAEMLRREGIKVGVCRIRSVRPFPEEEVVELADRSKVIGVFDRDVSMGSRGILATEIMAALKSKEVDTPVVEFIGGLGGRNLSINTFKEVFKRMYKVEKRKQGIKWVGLKEVKV